MRVLWGFLSSCVRFRISFMISCGSYTHAHTRLVAVSTFPSPLSGAWRHAVIPSVWFSPGSLIMTHTSLAACGKTSWKHLGWSCQLFNYLAGWGQEVLKPAILFTILYASVALSPQVHLQKFLYVLCQRLCLEWTNHVSRLLITKFFTTWPSSLVPRPFEDGNEDTS